MANVFVTGGSGFIGRALIGRLIAEGDSVSAFVRSEETALVVAALGARPVMGRLEEPSTYAGAASGSDVFFHLAAQTDLAAELNAHVSVTVNGTRAALDAARSASVPISSYGWDGYGRLQTSTVGGTTVCYLYDPAGNLLTRTYQTSSSNCNTPTGTTNYLLGDLYETNAADTITTSYDTGPAGNLASYNGPPTTASTITYLYYDNHGNQVATTNSSGTTTNTQTYDPWGAPQSSVPSNQTIHAYVGRYNKQYDTATNLILMGARPYDPTLGRFLAVDPVDGGSLNNYDYCGQDPVDCIDVQGTEPDWPDIIFCILDLCSPDRDILPGKPDIGPVVPDPGPPLIGLPLPAPPTPTPQPGDVIVTMPDGSQVVFPAPAPKPKPEPKPKPKPKPKPD